MSSDTLNVMHIILDLKRAGAQEVVRTLAEYSQINGCTVTVCAFQDGPMRPEIEELGIKVNLLERPRYSVVFLPMFLIDMWRIRRGLAFLMEAHQVDVAQTHLLEALDFVVLSLRHNSNLRVVLWTIHNTEFLPTMKHWLLRPKRLIYRLLYRLLAGQVNGFIAVSDEVRRSILHQIGPIQEKVFTIHNGVDLRILERTGENASVREGLGLGTDSRLIATVGRLTEQKGHRYLIEAARTVVSIFPDTHFLFIGDGELRGELQQQTQQAGLSDNVHFLGVREDVPSLLATANLFILPSLWEGLSIALLEAMAAGKPIVATAVSGTKMAIAHRETGLLVPPGDSSALTDAIIQLLSDTEQAQAMGRQAKQYVARNYSARKQADDHVALYRRLLSGGRQ